MGKAQRQVRIQDGGQIVPTSKIASQLLAARAGTWVVDEGTTDAFFLRRADGPRGDAAVRLAGQITLAGALCDVLALIGQSGWSGALVVQTDDGTRTLEFDAGRVTSATSTVRLERFGELVYRFGLATRDQIDAARRSAAITGTTLADALLEQDVVDAPSLEPVQRRHVEEIFFAVVRAHEGSFYFFDQRLGESELPRPHPSTSELLMEGARRMDEMLAFRAHVPSERHVPEPVVGKKPPAALEEIFAQCDGKRSVADVGRQLGLLEYEVTQLLVRLVEGGYVSMKTPRPRGPEAITELMNGALAELHRVCDRGAVGTELRDALSRFVGGAPSVGSLVSGAGPQDDGTFVAARVARNLRSKPGAEPMARLVKNLEEYVSFGLFIATSLLVRDDAVQLKARIAELLRPLDRASHSVVPASVPPRHRRPPPVTRVAAEASGEFRINFTMPPAARASLTPPKQKTVPPPSSKGKGARSR